MTDRRPIILVLLIIGAVLCTLVAFDVLEATHHLRIVAGALALVIVAWIVERL